MKVKNSLVTSPALLLLALILTSVYNATLNKDYCEAGKCAYCEASTNDSTYKSCTDCVNSKSVLVNTSTDCGLSDCSSVPNDVYYCTGSITMANCLIEYNPGDIKFSGCKFCEKGYKREAPTTGTGINYNCVSHGVSNCLSWDNTNQRCEACDEGYEMTNTYTCTQA